MLTVNVTAKRGDSTVLRQLVKRMVDAKAEEVLAQATADCPKGTGKLARTGRTRASRRTAGRGYFRSVVFGGARAPYALIVHEGHGVITPHRKGGYLVWEDPHDGLVYAKRVSAQPGRPFLRNALVKRCRGWNISLFPVG